MPSHSLPPFNRVTRTSPFMMSLRPGRALLFLHTEATPNSSGHPHTQPPSDSCSAHLYPVPDSFPALHHSAHPFGLRLKSKSELFLLLSVLGQDLRLPLETFICPGEMTGYFAETWRFCFKTARSWLMQRGFRRRPVSHQLSHLLLRTSQGGTKEAQART